MSWLRRSILALVLSLSAAGAAADDMLMVRARIPFAETMLALQEAISAQGYTLSRVQRVDIGLTEFGFKTDKYRVVFFGKPDEIRRLTETHPELIPYMPLQVAIFAEENETLLATTNPTHLTAAYDDAELTEIFARWANDLQVILEKVRQAE